MSIKRIGSFDLNTIGQTMTFVLDTNILYFVHSGYYTKTYAKYIAYSNLLQQIFTKGNPLLITALNLQELVFGIENKEYELHLALTGKDKRSYTKKSFRKDPTLRADVQTKVKTVLTEIRSIYTLRDNTVKLSVIDQFVADYTMYLYDPMDYLVVNDTNTSDVIYITDDTDFQSDSRINVLTI